MKKALLASFVLIFLSSSFAYSGGSAPNTSMEPKKSYAKVSHVKGKPILIWADGPHLAKVGMSCKNGNQMEVNAESELDIAMNDVAGVRLLGGSKGTLVRVDKDDMRVALEDGNAIFNLESLDNKSSFILETPIAVAAVRGTQFWGRVQSIDPKTGQMASTLAVREGKIDVRIKKTGKQYRINKGEAIDLFLNQKPTTRRALDAELKAMEQASQIKTSA